MTEQIHNIDFSKALGERYFSYALSTIMSRSLPDVRDGLKPVHRRILYAMLRLHLEPNSGFKKCARVVGDVIGKYHPHGDIAVYDALVRLAQSFSARYPLVEGQGNFGSVDGDNAAAMRYTEARLTDVAMALLQDIEFDTVDFRPTYDDGDSEPALLPAAFPNLLANGSEGIAVGMATSIPPHNAGELADALLHLLKHPEASIAKLVDFVQAPDFPTGGVLIESKANIIANYTAGRGSFRIRAKWHKEDLKQGAYQIIITEIPYQVQKSRLLEKMADLLRTKKVQNFANIMDESAEEIRVVIEPRSRATDAESLMEQLFKLTELETRYSLNLNVLDKNSVPHVMNLREVLNAFIAHRFNVLVRKSTFRIGKIDERLEILGGLLIAYLNLDEVIRIIREEDEPKKIMIAKWKLSDVQAEAILNMRLRSLRKLEEIKIKEEQEALLAERKELQEILDSEGRRKEVLTAEFKEVKRRFGQKAGGIYQRQTTVDNEFVIKEVSEMDFIPKEPLTIICSKLGWIRAVKGHKYDLGKVKYKEGDKEKFVIEAQSTDKLVIFADNGRFYTLDAHKISRGKTDGEPLNLIVDIEQGANIADLFIYEKGRKLLMASLLGKGFIVESDDIIAQTKNGKQILALNKDDKAIGLKHIREGDDKIALLSGARRLLIFDLAQIPVMKKGKGVILQKQAGCKLLDFTSFKLEDGLKAGRKFWDQSMLKKWFGTRATRGLAAPSDFPRSNKF
jgi:topoisomerase-4 subunit A